EDRVEADALTRIIGATSGDSPCWVGSVKPEIGHTGSASGLASVLRAALSLYHQLLPPFGHPRLDPTPWNNCPRQFATPAAAQYWLRNRAEGPRRALVTSLGGDGSCSAVVLEGLSGKGKRPSQFLQHPLGPLREGLFALGGTTVADIQEQIDTLEQLRQKQAQTGMDHLARLRFLAQPPATTPARCLALVAASSEELYQQLSFARRWLQEHPEQRLDGNGNPSLPAAIRDRLFYAPEPLATRGRMAFIFPGSGNHFAGMGRDLSSRWADIFRIQDARSQYLIRQYLPQHFWGNELAESIHDNHNALVSAQVALGTAVSDLVRSFGIEPQAVSGYSLGESAGLFSFDAWQDREGMSRRLRESTLFTESLAGPCRAAHQTWKLSPEETVDWAICLVPVAAGKVRQALSAFSRVYLLIINTYEECVLGGDRQQLEQLVSQLGCPSIPLRGITTVHCEVVDPVAQAYRDLHRFPTTPPEDIRFYRCGLGHSYELDEESVADAILNQALATIDYPRLVEQLYADGVRIFLEMGPGNSCSRMISRILKDRPHLTRAACLPGQDAASLILRLLAQCLAEGIAVDLRKLYPDAP
ncbi:MAG: type I polyketide synthase, partial [Desulfuromonadaceae bacterium]